MKPSSIVTIRPATAGDANALARLLTQLGYPVAPEDVPARLDRLAAQGRAAVLLAEVNGAAIGLATAHLLSVLNRAADVVWLTALVVDDAARGTGVGRQLVAAVEAFGRAHGCERISVTTHEDRMGAREFYPRIGFEATGRRFGKVLRNA